MRVQLKTGFGKPLQPTTLQRAKRGDMEAYALIYQHYARSCYTLALRMLGDRAAAEDVVQDVFLKVMDTIGSFRGDAPFGAWLKRMTSNATIDVIRRNRRFSTEAIDAVLADRATQEADQESSTEAWALLTRLSPRARSVLVLHQVEGYTHKELGELFGQSESYSKSILARTLKRLHSFTHTSPQDES